jgi:hypothetical protein
MKLAHGTALIAALLVAGLPAARAMAAEPTDAAVTQERAAIELRNSNRERVEQAQAEAARVAAEALLSATKLDLDIRLIGPTSITGDL